MTPVQPRVAVVVPLPGQRLHVQFADGIAGEVDCKSLIDGEQAGVFAALRNPIEFDRVGVEHGAVTWACGLDLAPDAMYDEVRQNGRWVLR
ncbi:MAG: DUF2442 domain-containing protein [Burkholderiales bacterium]|nr:DUF2442 domain-containing protein [Burkholderiales bacterium]